MSAFNKYREAIGAELNAVLPQRIAAVDWDKETLQAHRSKALAKLLSHTDEHSRWHHKRFRGIDLSSISPDNIAALPTMTKMDLTAHFDDISTDPKVTKAWCEAHLAADNPYTDGSYIILASGGSSGHRAMQVYSPNSAAEFGSAGFRHSTRFALRKNAEAGRNNTPLAPPDLSKQVWIVAATGAAHATRVLPPILGFHEGNMFAVTDPMDKITAKLNALQPTHLVIYSSYLRHLIQAQEDGRLNISPINIALTSETPNPVDITRAKALWGCNIGSNWASIEFGTMGFSSGFEEGHLLSDDMLIIEAADEDNQPILAGEKAAKLLITNLYNTTVPLIRYELTDQLTIFNQPAKCGSNLRLASLVEGRLDDHFVYEGNIRVHSHLFRHVLEQRSGILEYQVKQTATGANLLLVPTGTSKGSNDTACDDATFKDNSQTQDITQRLERDLENIGVNGAKIHVDIVPSIQRTAAQKLTRFISL